MGTNFGQNQLENRKNPYQHFILGRRSQWHRHPPFWTFLKDKKQGNSDYNDRIRILKKFIRYFGKKRIDYVLGDREFIGKEWVDWLQIQSVKYVMRIKENGQHISTIAGKMVKAKQLLRRIAPGQNKAFQRRTIGKTKSYVSYVSGLKTEDGELVILIHSAEIKNPCEIYRNRWQIEHLFKAFKSAGFNLESTHVVDYERLNVLLSIIAIAYCLAFKMGRIILDEKAPAVKKHGYKAKSVIRYGLDFFIALLRGCYKKTRILVFFMLHFELDRAPVSCASQKIVL